MQYGRSAPTIALVRLGLPCACPSRDGRGARLRRLRLLTRSLICARRGGRTHRHTLQRPVHGLQRCRRLLCRARVGRGYGASTAYARYLCAAGGRMGRWDIAGRTVEANLAKNPVGFDRQIQSIKTAGGRLCAFFLNDNDADGTMYRGSTTSTLSASPTRRVLSPLPEARARTTCRCASQVRQHRCRDYLGRRAGNWRRGRRGRR